SDAARAAQTSEVVADGIRLSEPEHQTASMPGGDLQRPLALPSKPDREPITLHRSWIDAHFGKTPIAPLVREGLVTPGQPKDLDSFLEPTQPMVGGPAKCLRLFDEPAGANSKFEATFGIDIEGGCLLCQGQGIGDDQRDQRRAEAHALGNRRGEREAD